MLAALGSRDAVAHDDPACLGDATPFLRGPRLPYVAVAGHSAPVLVDLATTSSSSAILGTDRTRHEVLAVDYARGVVRRAPASRSCAEPDLVRAGLTPLSSAGFFANHLSKLKPLASVVEGGSPEKTVANVPTVPIRVAGLTASAQLDTGFDDAVVPFSVNVNEAFLAAILADHPQALVRVPGKDVTLTTCAGVDEPASAYELRAGTSVELVGESGRSVRRFEGATLFVKHPPDAARRCGGIGTWSVPAAQIGASFFAELGLVVFDPFGSRVWVRR